MAIGQCQPGLTWSRRFNIPERMTPIWNQTKPPPNNPSWMMYAQPINPGQAWGRRFGFPIKQTRIGNPFIAPTVFPPAQPEFNMVSADDLTVGVYCPNWSNPGWTTQTLVSPAQSILTGGTYD